MTTKHNIGQFQHLAPSFKIHHDIGLITLWFLVMVSFFLSLTFSLSPIFVNMNGLNSHLIVIVISLLDWLVLISSRFWYYILISCLGFCVFCKELVCYFCVLWVPHILCRIMISFSISSEIGIWIAELKSALRYMVHEVFFVTWLICSKCLVELHELDRSW